MRYKSKSYFIENFNTERIANKFSTPIYCYSFKKLKENVEYFKNSFTSLKPLICFSVKSNSNKRLLSEINNLGLGADVVSLGELMKALKSGIKPNKIVFSGVGKSSNEIAYAIKKKILLINAESESEILEIERISKLQRKVTDIGIRLNPNTDAKTLSKISTGKKENKFGVSEKVFLKMVNYILNSKNLSLKCLSVHIGSQILDHKPYEKMLNVLDKVIKKSNFKFDYIDLGGGMGIDYNNKGKKLDLKKYCVKIKKFLKNKKSKIIFEPGRSIIGNTGILISKILYIKEGFNKDFIILDAGMNDFMRPALYNANHQIIPVKKNKIKAKKIYEFVGPICESTDKFLTVNNFQKLKEKDFVIIRDVGAYGTSLSNNYNIRPKPVELLIKNSKLKVIAQKQKLKDLI